MTAYSTVCRAIAKAIAMRTFESVPSVDANVAKGPIVDMVLAKVPNFVFRESTSLGLAATHASLNWPTTAELDDDHKVRLVLQMDPILAEEVDRLAVRLGDRLNKAQTELKTDIGYDVQTAVAAIEGLMSDYQAGLSGRPSCEVMAFDWGALNNSDVISAVDSSCSQLYSYFPTAVRSGELGMIPALLEMADQFQLNFTKVNAAEAINWPHLQDIAVSTDTVDALCRPYRANQLVGMAGNQLLGSSAECVEGITKLSRLYNDLTILNQDQTFKDKYPELVDNIPALRNKLLVGLGCGMIAQNSALGETLIMAYTPERLIVNGYTYATLENPNPEAIVQVADYLTAEKRFNKYGVTAASVAAIAPEAEKWHAEHVALSDDQVKQGGAEFYSKAVISTMTEWASRQLPPEANELSPRMAFEIDHLARDLNSGQGSLTDGVMKLMVNTKASPATERLAAGIVGAVESYGDKAEGALESVAMTDEIMRSLLSKTLAVATYTD